MLRGHRTNPVTHWFRILTYFFFPDFSHCLSFVCRKSFACVRSIFLVMMARLWTKIGSKSNVSVYRKWRNIHEWWLYVWLLDSDEMKAHHHDHKIPKAMDNDFRLDSISLIHFFSLRWMCLWFLFVSLIPVRLWWAPKLLADESCAFHISRWKKRPKNDRYEVAANTDSDAKIKQ